jgi:hypothetical protein
MNLLLVQGNLTAEYRADFTACCVLDQTGPVWRWRSNGPRPSAGQVADPAPIYGPVRDKGVVSWARAKHMARKKKKKPVRTRARKAKRACKPQCHRTEPLDELTKKYMDQGLPADQARERARAELRANNREDWWSG